MPISSKYLRIPVTDKAHAAIRRAAERRKITVAELVRQAVSTATGQPVIADMPPVGSPGGKKPKQKTQ